MVNLTKSLVMPNGQEYEFVGKHWYGTCTTAAATQTKTVSITGFTSADLVDGVQITVYFTNAQTYNGTPRILLGGSYINIYTSYNTVAGQYEWAAGAIITFVKEGSRWVIIDGGHADTTYWGKTKLSDDIVNDSTLSASARSVWLLDLVTPKRALYHELFSSYSSSYSEVQSWLSVANRPLLIDATFSVNNGAFSTNGLFSGGGEYDSQNAYFFVVPNPFGAGFRKLCVTEDDVWHDLGDMPYQTTANLVTSVSSASTDAQYPSAKLFYDTVGDIETLLASI